jgi:hypothetical protein
VVPGLVVEATGAVIPSETNDAIAYGVVDESARRVWLTGGHVLAVRGSTSQAGLARGHPALHGVSDVTPLAA